MPRITVNINQNINDKLIKISKENKESISYVVKQFIESGIYQLENNDNKKHDNIEIYCHQLAIQSNAFLRKISMKLLELSSEELEIFKIVSRKKYKEILENKNTSDLLC